MNSLQISSSLSVIVEQWFWLIVPGHYVLQSGYIVTQMLMLLSGETGFVWQLSSGCLIQASVTLSAMSCQSGKW